MSIRGSCGPFIGVSVSVPFSMGGPYASRTLAPVESTSSPLCFHVISLVFSEFSLSVPSGLSGMGIELVLFKRQTTATSSTPGWERTMRRVVADAVIGDARVSTDPTPFHFVQWAVRRARAG